MVHVMRVRKREACLCGLRDDASAEAWRSRAARVCVRMAKHDSFSNTTGSLAGFDSSMSNHSCPYVLYCHACSVRMLNPNASWRACLQGSYIRLCLYQHQAPALTNACVVCKLQC